MDIEILNIGCEQVNRVTICNIFIRWHGKMKVFRGVAIRHPEDKNNNNIGENLALIRATNKMNKTISRWTEGQIKLIDHNKQILHRPLEEWQQASADADKISPPTLFDAERRVPRFRSAQSSR